MPDCYDTRSLTQSMIDAIVEIWDSAERAGRRVSGPEDGTHAEATGVFLAGEKRERRHNALVVKLVQR